MNKLKYFLYASSTTTKVICGLALALPLHILSPAVVMRIIDINYGTLDKLIRTYNNVTPIASGTPAPIASPPPSQIASPEFSPEKTRDALTLLLFCAIAGSTGSIVSILTRLDKYDNDKYTDAFLPILLGIFKPTIGAVYGMFVFFLIGSNFLPTSINIIDEKSPDKRYFSIIAIAFLAGLSERFAKDIVSKTEDRFLTKNEAEKILAQRNDLPAIPVDSTSAKANQIADKPLQSAITVDSTPANPIADKSPQ